MAARSRSATYGPVAASGVPQLQRLIANRGAMLLTECADLLTLRVGQVQAGHEPLAALAWLLAGRLPMLAVAARVIAMTVKPRNRAYRDMCRVSYTD